MYRYLSVVLVCLGLTACAPVPTAPTSSGQAAPAQAPTPRAQIAAQQAARQFVEVVSTVEPLAESECRKVSSTRNCDFQIVVDDRPNQQPNAFQTIDKSGRPILAFNLALIASVRNADELAFVMGHEAAHHILSHIDRARESATVGAVIFSGIAAVTGASAEGVRQAEQIGAAVGARTYSKDFELEADRLGTIITAKAGYDPVRGSAFFQRIPDPGDRFLGTHPPNAQRIEIVRRTAAQL